MYIPFTDEQKQLAAAVDLPCFLERYGIELQRSGQEFALAANPYIKVRGNKWFDHATGSGGGPVSFAQAARHQPSFAFQPA